MARKYFISVRWNEKQLDALATVANANPREHFILYFQNPDYDNRVLWNRALSVATFSVVDLMPPTSGSLGLTAQQAKDLIAECMEMATRCDATMQACEMMNFPLDASIEQAYRVNIP